MKDFFDGMLCTFVMIAGVAAFGCATKALVWLIKVVWNAIPT